MQSIRARSCQRLSPEAPDTHLCADTSYRLNSRGNLREALDGRTVELVGLQSTTAMTSANSESTVRTPGGGAWGKQSSSAPAYYEMDIDGGQKDSTNV